MMDVVFALVSFIASGPGAGFIGADGLSGLASLMTTLPAVLLDDEWGVAGIFILLLAGPAFYTITYMRYRNTDKRHTYEKETPSEMSNLRQFDNLIQQLKRQDSRTIRGANNMAVTGTLGGGSTGLDPAGLDFSAGLEGALSKMMSGVEITSRKTTIGGGQSHYQINAKLKPRR